MLIEIVADMHLLISTVSSPTTIARRTSLYKHEHEHGNEAFYHEFTNNGKGGRHTPYTTAIEADRKSTQFF